MRGRRLLFGLVAVGLGAFAARCSVYDPSLLAPDPSRPAPKNGVGWWSGAGDRGCFSARAPRLEDRPTGTSDKALPPIYLAIQSMRIGSLNEQLQLDSNAWQDLGYDLDGICTGSDTCEGDDSPPSCKPPVPQISIDGRYCRDNTFGRLEYAAALVPELSNKYGLSDDAFNCALCVGHYNYLIKLSGYNGEADDDRVRVDLYPSPGLEKPLPWDCADPSWRTRPCFTSDMPFTVQEDGVLERRPGPDLSDAKQFDDNAFVKDGYLVATLPPNTLFWFPGFNALVVAYPLRFTSGIVSGKLARGPDGVWRITDAIIGGRARADDLVQGFRLMGLCEADQNYSLMADFVRNNQDLLADGANDPERTCDAMSVGLGFTALQAVAGKLAPVEPLVECVLRGKRADDAGAPDAGGD
ncbi:MAG: hypothetical protein KF819_00360 [Labilithrix sp.]|nr:hypothetical protein [Labilithrix sp.]